MNRIFGVTLLIFAVCLLGAYALTSITDQQNNPAVNLVTQEIPAAEFQRADQPRPFKFPDDFGPHPEFQTEWWYYTGNLRTSTGQLFGYQLTLFRRGLLPLNLQRDRPSSWATSQVYLGHFAVTNVSENEHYFYERFARGAAGIAGAHADPYRVWLDEWIIEQTSPNQYRVYAAQDGISIDLNLIDKKGPVAHGDGGYSQKGPDPGNASYYYSQTRLDTFGKITISGQQLEVTGLSWKDHEYSTSALAENQVGWDWFALQLDDGTELKVFHIRQSDGSIDPFSNGSYIDQAGKLIQLSRQDFQIKVLNTWRSPNSGATYPSRWEITVPNMDTKLTIEPYVSDQEMIVSYTYWEGAVRITGVNQGKEVTGSGYAELTGYAGSMAGEF